MDLVGFWLEMSFKVKGVGINLHLVTRCLSYDLPSPTASVGTRTDYSVGPWDYPTCTARHLMA
jgi:hypothetical protein